jgi:chromosome segregation ATPase
MATMEDRSLGANVGSDHAPQLEGPHGERRRRAHEVLSAQDAYLERLEQTLTEQLSQLAGEVAQSVERAQAVSGDRNESAAIAALQAQFDALKQKFAALDTECEELRNLNEQAQLELARGEQNNRVRETLLKEAQTSNEQRRVELATLREQLADAQAQLAAARARQQALDQELSAARELATNRDDDTKAQRRRIAREFKQQRAERLAEFAERKAELETLSQQRHATLEAQLSALQADLAASEARHAEQLATLQNSPHVEADPKVLRELRDECDSLTRKLAAAEAKLNDRSAGGGEQDSRKRDDLQRRFEMAVEEVRELKRTNAELENKLKSRGTGGGSPSPASGGALDWEAQKERLLASLEADGDDDEEAAEERTSIEGTIRVTDQIVAQKDREISELKERLEQHGGAGSSQSAAIAELLDRDEIIRQEREKLTQLQVEWRQKIGEAEIEISVQRAKLARDRAELDEKVRQYQLDQDNRSYSEDASETSKPTRGKWLARLGLKDLDEQK